MRCRPDWRLFRRRERGEVPLALAPHTDLSCMDPNGELLWRKPLLGTSVKRAGASHFEDHGLSITLPYRSSILECYPLPQEA
jgi:hypothetical protein